MTGLPTKNNPPLHHLHCVMEAGCILQQLLHFPPWLLSFAGALASLELELWEVDDEAQAPLLPATLEMVLTLWCWEGPRVWKKFGFWLEQALLHLPVLLKSKTKYGISAWSEHRFKIISFTARFPKMVMPIGPAQAKKVGFGTKHRHLKSCNICKRLLGKNFPAWNNFMPNQQCCTTIWSSEENTGWGFRSTGLKFWASFCHYLENQVYDTKCIL